MSETRGQAIAENTARALLLCGAAVLRIRDLWLTPGLLPMGVIAERSRLFAALPRSLQSDLGRSAARMLDGNYDPFASCEEGDA